MSVVGFDFGNSNCVVAVARKRGIDVIANEASARETPTIVGFKSDQRTMGVLASSQLTSNLTNSISNFKLLLGRKWGDPEIQEELKSSFYTTAEAKNNTIGLDVNYNNESRIFCPEQITAMMFTQLRKIVEKDSNNQIKLQEVVLSVPPHFNDAQRRALKDSAAIAGINCVQLLSEPMAVAIPWGMYKKDLPEDDTPVHVMFVNFGESSLWASVVAVSKSKLSVLSAVSDPNLGGRNFDDILVDYFAEIIKEQYKIDVKTNKRAILRLKTQCQRVKKVLTTNPESPLFVESIMNDIDVRSSIKRDVFQGLSTDLVARISSVVTRALVDAKIEKLDVVEVVGGSSYVMAFQEAVQDATKIPILSHTLNKSEAVARGCALQCAIVSPQFHINKNTTLKDFNPYSIRITWTELSDSGDKATKSALLFAKGCALNTTKRVTVKKCSTDIEITAKYDSQEEFPYSMDDLHIGTYSIPAFAGSVENSEKCASLEVLFKLDASALFSLTSARAIEFFNESVTKPVVKEGDAKAEEGEKAADDKMETEETETTIVEKKKTTELKVTVSQQAGFSSEHLAALKLSELNMQAADDLAIATADARNALESYSYDAQSKLQYDFSEWTEFATEEEKTKLLASVDDTLSWLYGEGEEATKDVFQKKLNELQVMGSPIELRRAESESRVPALEGLMEVVRYYKAFVSSEDEKYEHITAEKRQTVTDKINETEDWINKMKEKQEELPKTSNPILLTTEIDRRKSTLVIFGNTVVNTPKPKPAPIPKTDDCSKDDCCSGKAACETEACEKMDTSDKETPADVPAPAEDGKIEEVSENKEGADMDLD